MFHHPDQLISAFLGHTFLQDNGSKWDENEAPVIKISVDTGWQFSLSLSVCVQLKSIWWGIDRALYLCILLVPLLLIIQWIKKDLGRLINVTPSASVSGIIDLDGYKGRFSAFLSIIFIGILFQRSAIKSIKTGPALASLQSVLPRSFYAVI